jgi:hypothetical protein
MARRRNLPAVWPESPPLQRRVYAAYQSTFFTEIDFQTWFQPASLP